MSKLNTLGLPVAQLQESPIINDLSVLSKAVPPPDFAGSVKIGPENVAGGNTAPNQFVINYQVSNNNVAALVAGAHYNTVPIRVLINGVWADRWIVLADAAL